MKYLVRKGNIWWVKIDIPSDCQAQLGKRNWVETTDTGDIPTAKQRRDQIERQVKDVFSAIRAGTFQQDTLGDLGASLRKAWMTAADHSEEGEFSEKDMLAMSAKELADRLRPQEQKAFEAAWTGQEDTDKYVSDWLREARLSPKTTAEWKGLTARFQRWAKAQDLKLAGINRKVAGRYVAEVLAPMHPTTAAKHVSCLKGYWAYLMRRSHVATDQGNVWTDQLQPQRAKGGDKVAMQVERALTVVEVKKLTSETGELADLSLVAALSGMRLGEILSLTKEAVVTIDGIECFDLAKAKSKAGVRVIPVHSGLAKLVEARTKSGPFWPEFEGLIKASVSKRFATYRRRHGINEIGEGKRRALTNFHSLRKTFVTLARHAGMNEATIGQVVGHEQHGAKGLAFSVYSNASTKQMQEVVESVKIPVVV
ncbi:DUF6538 domain-containing protein [Phyllobacterium sp. P5_D12]